MRHVFFKNYFSFEAVSPIKYLDLTVNNTHRPSSVSFASNKSIATPDAWQNLKNFIERDFDKILSAAPIMYHFRLKGQVVVVCQLMPIIWLMLFFGRKFYFWGGNLKQNNKTSTNYLIFYLTITMKSQNNFFFTKASEMLWPIIH